MEISIIAIMPIDVNTIGITIAGCMYINSPITIIINDDAEVYSNVFSILFILVPKRVYFVRYIMHYTWPGALVHEFYYIIHAENMVINLRMGLLYWHRLDFYHS